MGRHHNFSILTQKRRGPRGPQRGRPARGPGVQRPVAPYLLSESWCSTPRERRTHPTLVPRPSPDLDSWTPPITRPRPPPVVALPRGATPGSRRRRPLPLFPMAWRLAISKVLFSLSLLFLLPLPTSLSSDSPVSSSRSRASIGLDGCVRPGTGHAARPVWDANLARLRIFHHETRV